MSDQFPWPDHELPPPDSAELEMALPSRAHHLLYEFLYQRRNNPPTMREIRAHVAAITGEEFSQTDRRVRELKDLFIIQTLKGRPPKYLLAGLAPQTKSGVRKSISSRLRAQVLAPQRCAQCGRTPLVHGVVLEVDHKLPWEWGGTDDFENLQPLCQECNSGKKHYYATYDEYADEIRAATQFHEPHRRIGELLKAFYPNATPGELIGVVASMHQYQEDWQKRLRELRFLGWVITNIRRRDPITHRTTSLYRLDSYRPWPEGPIAAEVARRDPSNSRYIGPVEPS